jgi:peptidoglycan L-alanyl-D-glutamate endopeptidase CwlK
MPQFSNKSKLNLLTCDQKLQELCFDAIGVVDFSVICGHRGKEAQNKAYKDGDSRAKWGESRHNISPSRAVDLLPYPYGYDDINQFYQLAGVMKALAFNKGYNLKWGGDFEGFFDGAHFELGG